ncbi:glycosyl transferase, family 2 [unidentified eubacterium SCB49]|nr:glycosyl transferase, family 2 [unidentified eubacterium SCB49]
MNTYIIIPAYNEEKHISKTLDSLLNQTVKATKIIVVDDSSTDNTTSILKKYSAKHSNISFITKTSVEGHEPGSKVVEAFNYGFDQLDSNFDIICKFDADLIFPTNYLEEIISTFTQSTTIGMVGGFCYIEKNGEWVLENLTNKDHIRGALKAYSKECFNKIGGLKSAMGWDTIDEIIAKFNGYTVKTIENLHVKHLKPTGNKYAKKAGLRQGEAFYRMRYGTLLTQIAAIKLALKKRQFSYYLNCLKGFNLAKKSGASFLLTEEEGEFLRNLRKEGIRNKIL